MTVQVTPGVLDVILDLCDGAVAATAPGAVHDGVAAVAQRLREPLRVAIAGRVSAGKSTLANALLGVPVAPTAAGECTRAVTWYRYGDQDSATIVLRDGSRRPLALNADRTLPAELPVTWEAVDCIEVELYCSPLRDFTLIDTPGASSLDQDVSARAAELLSTRSRHAARAADALGYVVTRHVHEDDQAVIEGFGEQTHGLRTSAANCVVVLNKADKLVDAGEDPSAVSVRLRDRALAELGPAVAAVVPVIGLLAETSACGLLDEAAARTVRQLAVSPAEQRARLGRRLGAVDDEQRRVLRRLDRYGLRRCVEAAAGGQGGARELTRLCEELSGAGELRRVLLQRFAARSHVLKADSALAALRALLAGASTADRRVLSALLRDAAEELALAPEGCDLRVIALLREVTGGRIELPAERRDDVVRWVIAPGGPERVGLPPGVDPGEARTAALELASSWRAYGNDPRRDSGQHHAAHVMAAAYALTVQAAS
jgi:GTP-binding protein EngB required for normal cell division